MKKLYGKSFLRAMLAAFIISVFTAVSAICVSAEPYQQRLVNLENQTDILVSIKYDVEIPQNVVFISPSGERLSAGVTDSSTLGMYKGDGYIDYKIYGAEAGEWYIEYEELTQGEAKFSVSLNTPITIENFKLTKIDGSSAEVVFKVNYDAPDNRYGYVITLLTENSQTSRELASGNAYGGSEVTRNLDLSNVATYDKYVLRLAIYSDNGIGEITAHKQTSAFSYKNPQDVEPVKDADITVNTVDRKIIIDWSDYYRGWAYTEVFADGAKEPFFTENSDASELTFDYDEDVTELEIVICAKASNKLSKPLEIAFAVKNLPVKIDIPENTNKTQGNIVYDIEDDTLEAKVTVNGRTGSFELADKGEYPVSLSDGINEIALEYTLGDVVYKSSKSVSVDMMPPELEIFEDVNNKYISGTQFVISGKTESGAIVTVNDAEAETDENGNFKYTANLSEGENAFKIKTSDSVGNAAVRTITLMCNPPKEEKKDAAVSTGGGGLLPLLITLGFSFFVIILLMIFVKKRSSREIYKNNMPLKIYLLNVLSGLVLVLAFAALIVCALFAIDYIRTTVTINDTETFSWLAIDNSASASELLDRQSLCFILMLVSGIGGVILAIVSLILKGIYRKKAPASGLAPKKARPVKEKKEKNKKSKKKSNEISKPETEENVPDIQSTVNAYGEIPSASAELSSETEKVVAEPAAPMEKYVVTEDLIAEDTELPNPEEISVKTENSEQDSSEEISAENIPSNNSDATMTADSLKKDENAD